MKLRWKLGIAIPLVLFAAGLVCWFAVPYCRFWLWEAYMAVRPVPSICKGRGVAFQTKVERIRTDAKESLKPGAKKADVIGFFASENVPVDFHQVAGYNEASGQIYVRGLAECASVACGDDSALIGVSVQVDESGTVLSEPEVVGMYTDCL